MQNILSKYLGEGAKILSAIFARARELAPAVVFFYEFDELGRARTDDETSQMRRDVSTTLLQCIDGLVEADCCNTATAEIGNGSVAGMTSTAAAQCHRDRSHESRKGHRPCIAAPWPACEDHYLLQPDAGGATYNAAKQDHAYCDEVHRSATAFAQQNAVCDQALNLDATLTEKNRCEMLALDTPAAEAS